MSAEKWDWEPQDEGMAHAWMSLTSRVPATVTRGEGEVILWADAGLEAKEQGRVAALAAAGPELLDRLETAVRWLRRLEKEYPGCLNEGAIDERLQPIIDKAKGA